jgi:hypothetical protein
MVMRFMPGIRVVARTCVVRIILVIASFGCIRTQPVLAQILVPDRIYTARNGWSA